MNVLDVIGVTRHFGTKVALDDVSVRLATGEIRALLGPNGVGKTTLLRVILGLIDPTSGRSEMFGESVTALPPKERRRRMGFIPSGDRTFYMRLSGAENLYFFARLNGIRGKSARQRVDLCLERVGLADAVKQPVGTYSHGMQKRLSVARALLTEPPLMLVDEATQGLDPEGVRTVKKLIATIAEQGTAVLWATQRLDELRGFAGSVTLLDRGKVTFGGTVEGLAEGSTDIEEAFLRRTGVVA